MVWWYWQCGIGNGILTMWRCVLNEIATNYHLCHLEPDLIYLQGHQGQNVGQSATDLFGTHWNRVSILLLCVLCVCVGVELNLGRM